MRLWGTDPRWMCRAHLLGEHRELHATVGMIRSPKTQASMRGLAARGAIATSQIKARHAELIAELARRGYPSGSNHWTPMDYEDELDLGAIDVAANEQDLLNRCEACRKEWTRLQSETKVTDSSASQSIEMVKK